MANELTMLFHDENDTLWKYFDVSKSTNQIGNACVNSRLGTVSTSQLTTNPDALVGKITDPASHSDNNIQALDTNSTYTYVMDESPASYDYLRTALFDITNDFDEENNYLLSVDDDTEDIISLISDNLLNITLEKVDYYTKENTMDDSLRCMDLLIVLQWMKHLQHHLLFHQLSFQVYLPFDDQHTNLFLQLLVYCMILLIAVMYNLDL